MGEQGRAETNTRFASTPTEMDWRAFLASAVAALERKWITPEVMTRAITVFRSGAWESVHELWVKSSFLTAAQADELCRPLDREFTTALYADGAGKNGTRYVVERQLNEGGMGRVLLSLDNALGRRVAVKALRREMQTPEAARMLAREARVTGDLEHPGIIPVYDAGISDDDGPFYVMRLVEQRSLDLVLNGLREREPLIAATWTLHRLLRTYVQVCQAVHYANTRGVIHCDLKPSNILLGSFGEVLVSDWGLAYSRKHGGFISGGTPAYMAPEQLGGAKSFDARTDVFALGVVLYRILALRSPFRGTHVSEVLRLREAEKTPPLPSAVAPAGRSVPAELDEITMKAMQASPDERYESVEALANAIDAFLEGTREREQHQHRAAGLVAQGDELAARYHETREERQKLAAELATLRLQLDPWIPLEERRQVWDLEDELSVVDALLVRTLQEAVSSYEQALSEQPKDRAARTGLARLYADLVERARERRDDLDRMYFEGLLRQYDDDGILVRAGGRPGWLNLTLTGEVTDIALAPIEERDRQLVPGVERRLRRSALEAVPAAPGSYVVLIRSNGRRLRIPVLVRGDRETQITVDLDHIDLSGDDETYVAGGAVALGSELAGNRALRDFDVAAFYIQTLPVTFGTYLEFLESMRTSQPGCIASLIPQAREGEPLWTMTPQGLTPTAAFADLGMSPESWSTIPVFGVDGHAAISYASWWSARTGKRYRLPTELEWEKAARGIDGRRYPWGDAFESIFCKMMHSRQGRARPEPVGTFASDVSPYGVRDLGGGIADWCTSVSPEDARIERGVLLASRGGAWCDSDVDCAVTARRRVPIDERSARLGFRLARDA